MLKHLACIMDGNRRWAKKNGLWPWEGHKEGVAAMKRVIKFCSDRTIPYLSLYMLSLENLVNRPDEERHYLFNVLPQLVGEEVITVLKEHNARARFIGDRERFPKAILPYIERFEKESAANTGINVNLLFCYSSRQEILQGMKALMRKVKEGDLSVDDITEEMLEQSMWLGNCPPPDMILRTSGIKRMSNFMLYQGAYSELYFEECMWPEIQETHLQKALTFYNNMQRNFGA